MEERKHGEASVIFPKSRNANCHILSYFIVQGSFLDHSHMQVAGKVWSLLWQKENKKWVLVDRSHLPDYPLKKVSGSWHRKASGRQFVVQSLSHVPLFATPWTAACQASLSLTISWSLLKLMSIESVMLSNHLILCHPLLLMPSIFPSIRVFDTRWTSFLIDAKRANLRNYINLALYKIASCKAENNLSSLCRRLNGK